MQPSLPLSITTTLLLAVSQVSLKAEHPPGAAKPNIIFILADDQGWNGTSVQMHPDLPESKSDFFRTPHLETMAANGIRFSQAYSPGPMCSPTRASLQTGKSPAQLRMTDVGGGGPREPQPSQRFVFPPHTGTLSTNEVTIGETLREAGYATAWFGKFHLGRDGPGAHGYDQHDGPTGNADGDTGDPNNPKDIFGITKRGIAFMEGCVEDKKPFYLQLWHYAVHGPVQTRRQTEQAYADREPGRVHQSTAFAGMTEDLDTGVGMILDKLNDLSIADNTYVVYMGDHGFGGGTSNAPLNRGKGTLWEGGMRVPLIVSGPGVMRGGFCTVPTVGWDLFPTFCELAGVDGPLPKGIEGASLKPLFADGRGKLDRPGNHIAFHFPHYKRGAPHSTITRDGFKLIKFYDPKEVRLFDLSRDIGEQRDLATQDADRTTELENRLDSYLKTINAALPSPNPGFDPNAVAQTDQPPQGRGRRGGRQAQLEARKEALAEMKSALSDEDMDELGRLISTMKEAITAGPTRPPRPQGQEQQTASPRDQLLRQLEQLQEAQGRRAFKEIGTLIEQMEERLSNPRRGRGRGNGAQRPTPVETNAEQSVQLR